MVRVTRDLQATMNEAGLREYPNEACGLLVKVGKKSKAIAYKNTSDIPRIEFRIAAEDFAAASDMGEVIGVWHTHCNLPATPSLADRASCETSGVPWYILSVNIGESGEKELSEVTTMVPEGFEMPYLERPYVTGVFDCYSLIRDYYERECQISLGDYPRLHNWFNLGNNWFVERFKEEGFVQLFDEEPKVGDIFLIQSGSPVPNHMAVYLGEEKILHQTHGRLSTHDIYGGYWKKHTSHHLRHGSKC